ncbi:hypothetical protein ACFX13_041825 [Malus domestica]
MIPCVGSTISSQSTNATSYALTADHVMWVPPQQGLFLHARTQVAYDGLDITTFTPTPACRAGPGRHLSEQERIYVNSRVSTMRSCRVGG